jgi:hypothetical protein
LRWTAALTAQRTQAKAALGVSVSVKGIYSPPFSHVPVVYRFQYDTHVFIAPKSLLFGAKGAFWTLAAGKYRAAALLRDGRRIEIRALRPDDRANMLDEKAFYLNVDFVSHVALVVTIEGGGRTDIVGGARYIVVQPSTAEVAFAVDHQLAVRVTSSSLSSSRTKPHYRRTLGIAAHRPYPFQ